MAGGPGDMVAVELRRVSKVYPGGLKAVNEVDLRVPSGRVVALLGPSGCGKTTTLRLINRLEEASAGEVLVRGQNVRNVPSELLRRSIGYVIQEGGLMPHLNVAANVATVPRLLRWDRPRIRKRVEEVLDLVGLPEAQFGRRSPSHLSGGQRQRVGVARALAADPDLLLMDEPFGALDPGTREALQDEFLRLNTHLRKTVVLVTHDIAEAGRMADHIVLLDRGRVVQQGTLRDLLVRPADARVRAFIGRHGPELVLAVLQLGHLMTSLPSVGEGTTSMQLPAQMTLGQAMVQLARLPGDAVLKVDGAHGGACTVGDLVNRIRADVESAAGNAVSASEQPTIGTP